MTSEEAIEAIKEAYGNSEYTDEIIEALGQVPCEMTAEQYRQRMIQAFHNADCDELIAICVLPTEKEFEHLEWLLKSHYKKEPCEDAISRQAVCNIVDAIRDCISVEGYWAILERLKKLPSVNPQKSKTGHWIRVDDTKMRCSNCDIIHLIAQYPRIGINYCPNCGAKMFEQQESEDKE